jgi:hypothetical protein
LRLPVRPQQPAAFDNVGGPRVVQHGQAVERLVKGVGRGPEVDRMQRAKGQGDAEQQQSDDQFRAQAERPAGRQQACKSAA